ncbi:Pyridine nucleotide-disulphide oxidoreductase [Actinacidiphila alni]|uniref:Pyridine nucleotide-disulphide oxidoreductase n=1 Tax=Actinacidiphila alni TaxID=380248 RepID=A0A1I2IAW0_9ACTN|nr:FAD-dependent oxidoreductase [Actinacidiphila alni]SFF39354.1 Pyridine nucleotide-disulphide oxidoreductase [Actinacidiphila alni]
MNTISTANTTGSAARSRVVVAGGGLGAVRTVEELRALGHTGPVTVLCEESEPPYDRPPLTKRVLAGTLDAVPLWAPGRPESLEVRVLRGTAAAALDADRREVVDGRGGRHGFDHLVVATGAEPRVPPVVGAELLRTIRDLRDAHALRDILAPGADLVVIGGGVLGCEVAATAAGLGCRVVLVEAGRTLMERAVGAVLGDRLAAVHRGHRVDVRCATSVTEVARTADGRCQVRLTDGTEVTADAVVAAVGVRPRTDWLAGRGGPVLDDGVLCDAWCRASLPGVYAVGDVCRWTHPVTGVTRREEHWSAAGEQAGIVAHQILGLPGGPVMHGVLPYFWSDQYDLKIQVLGRPGTAPGPPGIEEWDRPGALLARFHDDDGRPVAAVGFCAGARLMRLRTGLLPDLEGAS